MTTGTQPPFRRSEVAPRLRTRATGLWLDRIQMNAGRASSRPPKEICAIRSLWRHESGSMSALAFHEKAGRCQEILWLSKFI
jgi:hypothetical protein